jgi:hypothetical protein
VNTLDGKVKVIPFRADNPFSGLEAVRTFLETKGYTFDIVAYTTPADLGPNEWLISQGGGKYGYRATLQLIKA